jgi:archaellum component FlaF (FlaF/FlaG flagellin family)
MKKLIFILFLFLTADLFSQSIDTANWSLSRNQTDGLWTMLINRTDFYGYTAGTVIVNLTYNASQVDTSKFQLIRSQTDGTYRQAINKIEWYGKDSGTVKINLTYDVNEIDTIGLAARSYVNSLIDTLPKLSEDNVWIGGQVFDSYVKFHTRTLGDGDTILASDVIVYHTGATSIYLCDPAVYVNRLAIVKNTGQDSWLLNPYGSETIDGQVNLNIASYESYILTSDGNNWFILAKQ